MPTLTFLGAARTVTGSKYLLEFGGRQILIDAGLFQGLKALRDRNWSALPFDPAQLDAIILTHAHIDHCGLLPRVVAQGFRGRVFCTNSTGALCRIVLPDSGHLQEEDARLANDQGWSKHTPALPLYTEADAWRAVSQLQPIGFNRPITITDRCEIEFIHAGHLLGSAFVRCAIDDNGTSRQVLFGGDLGRYDRPILPDPTPVSEAGILLLESTYGDRLHEHDPQNTQLANIISQTAARGGRLIIPSFAIGRVEEVLYWLGRLETEQRIPQLPVFLDSPMAVEALKHYATYAAELDEEARPARRRISAFATKRFVAIASARQSAELVRSPAPAIVIASSGMATGGRVLHHLQAGLPNAKNTVLFVGYQAAGTRGRLLVDGARSVRIHGQDVPVAAQIELIDSMSSHADQGEILKWLGHFTRPPALTFLVHGEPGPMDALKAAIESRLAWTVQTPEHLQRVSI